MRLTAVLVALAAFAAGATTAASAPPPARAKLTGVQLHPLWAGVTAKEVHRDVAAAKAAGAGIVRIDVGWASLEQDGKGQFARWYLRRVDQAVNAARARRLKVLVTLMSTPCWASSAPEDLRQGCEGAWWDRGVQHHPPTNAADYADALAFLVRRYRTRVAAWEVWNEPNQQFFFRSQRPAADYARLLRAAYPAAKRADRRAVVIGGSLAEADAEFTEALYAEGVQGSFDAWSIHPYSGDRSPLDPLEDPWTANSFVRGVPAVHDVLERHGDDKPLWLTEFGWSTTTVRGGEPWENGVDEERQARYLEQALDIVRGWDFVDAAIWFNLRDTSPDPADRVGNYGLLRHDGTRKPAFSAFQRSAR